MNQKTIHPKLELEYEQINERFRFLADVRFKLLALVPTLGGAAVFILAHVGLEAGKAPSSPHSELLVVLLVNLFGFLATLGITLYDQRNLELHNALIHRAKYLERQFGMPSTPGALRKLPLDGQFSERSKQGRRLILKAGHDLGLSLIYGPLLGAWLFPILYTAARLAEIKNECAQLGSAVMVGRELYSTSPLLRNPCGYATVVAFFGHAVGETNAEMQALIGAAPAFVGAGFLLPTRNRGCSAGVWSTGFASSSR